jgi:hypothetical protein
MKRFWHELVAAALLVLLTIPVYVAVGRALGPIVTATDDSGGPVPGSTERAIAVVLIGLAATNALGIVAGARVAWLGPTGWRGALRTWATAASSALALVMLAGAPTRGPSAIGSGLLDWAQALFYLALFWLPGIAVGTATAWRLMEQPERLAPGQGRESVG